MKRPHMGADIHCPLADLPAGDFRELPLREGYGWREIAMARKARNRLHVRLGASTSHIVAAQIETNAPGWFDERRISRMLFANEAPSLKHQKIPLVFLLV